MTLTFKKLRPPPLSELPLPLLLLAVGVVLAFAVSAMVTRHLIFNKIDAMANQYGNALVNLAARQAVDATLIRDLVSLQVILSDIAENPGVVNATIHDVENNLLVQAGKVGAKTRSNTAARQNFTAPITLGDSVAGFVTVTVDAADVAPLRQQLYWLFGLTATLMAALFMTAIFVGRDRDANSSAAQSIPIVSAPNVNTEKPVSAVIDGRDEEYLVDVQLQFGNLQELNTQLSSARFREILRRLKKHVQGALSLYNGQILNMDLRTAWLQFRGNESAADTAFQAICCARLLMDLNTQEQDFDIKYCTAVFASTPGLEKIYAAADREAQRTLLDNLFAHSPDGGILLHAELAHGNELADKLTIDTEFNATFAAVTAISEPYAILVEKQRRKLQGAVAGLPIVNA